MSDKIYYVNLKKISTSKHHPLNAIFLLSIWNKNGKRQDIKDEYAEEGNILLLPLHLFIIMFVISCR